VSPHTRVRLVVGAAALAAAAVAVAGGLLLDGTQAEEELGEPPALELGVLPGEDAQTRALLAAERTYEEGRREDARRRFEAVLRSDPSSLEAAVGAAVAAWPAGTVERLRGLAEEYPDSALVRLHLGLALYAEGRAEEAEAEWRQAESRDPDTPAAVRAEDLLHPDMAPGRPFFFPAAAARPELEGLPATEQLEELERRADGGRLEDLLLYGVALQRVGRPVSAQEAFDHALAREPQNLDAQVAAAVARFDKDAPERAFSRLGPLARDHPHAGVVRFHLGLLLLWIRAVDEARRQLERALETEGFYAREARGLLARLGGLGETSAMPQARAGSPRGGVLGRARI
jgi:tetratricopeptide (TPR) repeat protein